MGEIVGVQSIVIACAVIAQVGIIVMLYACVSSGAIPNGRQYW
jgi:hypothetical protein